MRESGCMRRKMVVCRRRHRLVMRLRGQKEKEKLKNHEQTALSVRLGKLYN
jgi:hypothetical protein